MNIVLPFLAGFITAFVGVLPPGLINMTASKISLKDGRERALLFIFGALIIIFFQTYISIIFAQYISKHQEILVLLREIGFVVFTGLSLYFLIFAKKPKIKSNKSLDLKSKKNRFFMGVLFSAINFFPIPYYVFISLTLASFHVFQFETVSIYSMVTGVVFGSFLVFYLYVLFFDKMKTKSDFLIRNMNPIIGIITGVTALATLFNIIQYYY